MATGRVSRGRKSQELAADYLSHLFPDVRAVAASLPGPDLLNTPGFSFEMKATERFSPTTALKQAREACEIEKEYPVAIYRPRGYGPEKIGKWVVMMDFDMFRGLVAEILNGREE